MPIVLWIIAGALTLLGGAGLWLGLRGRRVNDGPRCGSCGYNLTGLIEVDVRRPSPERIRMLRGAETCPECGHRLDAHGAVDLKTRVRRPGLIAASLVLLVLGAFGTINAARDQINRRRANVAIQQRIDALLEEHRQWSLQQQEQLGGEKSTKARMEEVSP